MPIALSRLIFKPAVSVITGTFIINPGLEDALIQINGEAIAEQEGTPLNKLTGRVFESGENTGGNGDDIAEFAGRQCYRSWRTGREASAYIENILAEAHGSVFEHAHVGFQITGVSRSYSHEQIRHSVGTGVSQESQRFVKADEIQFVVPPLLAYNLAGKTEEEMLADDELTEFRRACNFALNSYIRLREMFIARLEAMQIAGATEKAKTSYRKRALEAARAVLPNASETRMVYTTNLRALRHILLSRGNEYADLEIRQIAVEMLRCARDYAPLFFEDMKEDVGSDGYPIICATWGRC